ncbi:hypothetical protein ACFVTX_04665 [Agromyces sp. NPDC058136]|uniref:hypothetical protein n=1 Tax=Agromyces sp. NPDC058136 TaxID=3346354 RepID=UPI0036DF373D
MPLRTTVLTAATALVFAIGVLAPAAPASAEPLPAATAAAAGIAEEHCAIDITAGETRRAKAAEPVCFASIEEVDRYLEARSAATAESRSLAAASVAVGRIYENTDKGGSSLTFWGSSGCAGETFGFPSLSSGWSTSVSSVTGLNGCWATSYTATSYGGSRLNCTPYCSNMWNYNDKIKSLVFRPSGTLG